VTDIILAVVLPPVLLFMTKQHTPKYSEAIRKAGATAWHQANGDAARAIKLFAAKHPTECAAMPRPEKNLQRWAEEWADRPDYSDKHRSGRQRVIQDEARLRMCAAALKRTRMIGGTRRHYTSIQEAARYEKVIRNTMEEYGVTADHLLRACKRIYPNLTTGRERRRRYLTKQHRAKRMRLAKRLLRKAQYYWKKVFWLDAKHFYIVPPTFRVFCDKKDKSAIYVEDPHARTTPICLHYYAAVNWFTGAVALVWVTGTTGLKKRYVSDHPSATAHLAACVYFHCGTHTNIGSLLGHLLMNLSMASLHWQAFW
jgi:hypothetical protein